MRIKLTRGQYDRLMSYLDYHRQSRIIQNVQAGHTKRKGRIIGYVIVEVSRYHADTVLNFKR